MGEIYPLFRNYSLAVRDWLRNTCTLPRFERYTQSILKIDRLGTTAGGVNQSEIVLSSSNHGFSPGMIVQIVGSTSNDEYYSIEKVEDTVLILDQNYRRLRVNEDFSSLSEDNRPKLKRAINILYGNMERSVATIAQPLRNGLVDTPGISFFISDYQYRVEKSRPRENYFKRNYKDNNGNKIGVASVPPLQEYQVHYNVNVWSIYMQELDILQYQIVTAFAPEKYFWIGDKDYGFEYNGDRMDREHKGQWAHALIDTIADTSDLEPGDATNRTSRSEIGFMINNAYLPLPFETDQPMIGSIDIETILEES